MDREWYSEGITVSKTGGLFHFSGRAGMVGEDRYKYRGSQGREGETKKDEECLSRLSLARC